MTIAIVSSSSSAAKRASASPSSVPPSDGDEGGEQKLGLVQLVREAKEGKRAAFAELYDRYHRMVHAIVLSSVRTTHETEDVVQDVFTKALRQLPRLEEPERFGGWLATIARRSAVDLHRARRRSPTDALAKSNPSPSSSGSVEPDSERPDPFAMQANSPPPTSEAMEALRAIEALPEAYRETLMMRLVEGLSGPEIAALTGMTNDSVRVNLCRGMKLLRERLSGGSGVGDEGGAP
jgi:RNA polymerase sigma-70 factor (ECF subfamily)